MWYSSMVNSSTMQHNTRVYQVRAPFYNKNAFFSIVLELGELEYLRKKKKKQHFIKNGTRAWYTRVLCCMVLEFTMLEYHIIFFNGPISTLAVPRWQNSQELEFHKKWYFPIQFRNNVFLQNISKICGIWPFWPWELSQVCLSKIQVEHEQSTSWDEWQGWLNLRRQL